MVLAAFSIQVNINLSKSEARPSSILSISVKSKPLSYVGLLGVDQSVLLLKSGNDINQEMVTNELYGYTYLDQYNSDWSEPITYNYYTDFSAMDIFIMTNAKSEYGKFLIFSGGKLLGGNKFRVRNKNLMVTSVKP